MGINLRKPSQAIIPEGSITEEKLAEGAVNLSSTKVTGELPNSKLGRIDDVAKIKDNLLTLQKMTDDVKLGQFVGGEEEQSMTGTDEVALIETGFSRSNVHLPMKIRVAASLKKVGDSVETASLKFYIDEEVAPRLVLNTASAVYELLTGEMDISDLSNGKHKLVMKGVASSVTTQCWNDYIDILNVK